VLRTLTDVWDAKVDVLTATIATAKSLGRERISDEAAYESLICSSLDHKKFAK
jgi:hypothetical protein